MTEAEILALPYRPCVGIVLMNRAGGVFAGQRLDSSAEAWQMPQGGIDPGEAPRDAALRELGEETGIGPRPGRRAWRDPGLDSVRPAARPGAPAVEAAATAARLQRWYLMRFLGEDAQVDIATAHPEFRSWRWVEPAALIDMIVPFKRATYAAVFAAFHGRIG